MKKLFSIVAAILFAGSMFATEYTLTISASDFTTKSYADNNKAHELVAVSAANEELEVVVVSNQVMQQQSLIQGQKGNGYLYNETDLGTIKSITINDNENDFSYIIGAVEHPSEEAEGGFFTINAGSSKASKASSIVIVFEAGAPSTDPEIKAADVDFGTQYIGLEETEWNGELVLAVVGKHLESEIIISGSAHIEVEPASLPAEGGDVTLKVKAAVGDFSEDIVLSCNGLEKKVVVSGKVAQKEVLPGIALEMSTEGGEKAYAATVNGVAGIKCGTGTADGSFILTIPQDAAKLHFYAVAWNGAAGNIVIEAPEGVTVSAEEIDLEADGGIAGGSNDYTLQGDEADFRVDIELGGVNAETQLVFKSGTARRFVVWGATYEGSHTTLLDNSAVEFKAVKMIQNGQVIIVRDGVRYNMIGQVVE